MTEKKMPRMLTMKDTSRETGLSLKFLKQAVDEGKIVYVKSGRRYLINYDRLVDWLNGDQ
jgi:excisionase family DNA binding protein